MIEYVAQRDDNGCGVACLAMIAGASYKEVRADFEEWHIEQGLAQSQLLMWLNRKGFWYRQWWGNPPATVVAAQGRRNALALVHVSEGDHKAHWVVHYNGRYYDSARPEPLEQYAVLHWIELFHRKL